MSAGHADDIRLCLSCNQECVGRMGLNRWLGCIENPRTGRESTPLAPPVQSRLLLPKTSSMLVEADAWVRPMLYAMAAGGAFARRGTLWHGDRPC
jgi:hypothetical protein